MSITFENDNNVILCALEKVISDARRTQQIFTAQCVWWLVSIIGLEQGLVRYIDNLHERIIVKGNYQPENDIDIRDTSAIRDPTPKETKERQQDKVLAECEEFLRDSNRL
jgi:hypothetical protein